MFKEFRGLYQKYFGEKPRQVVGTNFELLNQLLGTYTNFDGQLYDVATARSCIHAIAVNCAKLKPRHLLNKSAKKGGINYNYMLSVRPNEYMNAFDFLYKVVTQLYCANNSFIYIHRDDWGTILGFYPINYSSLRLLECQGELFCQFFFLGGKNVTLPYVDLIHIRRHFNEDDLFGSPQNRVTYPILNVLHTISQGLINTIKLSAGLRGLIKFNSVTPDVRQKQIKKDFVEAYTNINNTDGFATLDSSADFKELKVEPQSANDKQMTFSREELYRYFNISENIIRSNYKEEEFNAFYSSVIEPIAIQLSLEFTDKVFSQKERGFGNEIVFSAERMTFASNQTRANIINILRPLGILTANQAMQIMELPTVNEPWADKHIISLNYVEASKANQYQGVGDDNSSDNSNNNGDNEDGKQEEINTDA